LPLVEAAFESEFGFDAIDGTEQRTCPSVSGVENRMQVQIAAEARDKLRLI